MSAIKDIAQKYHYQSPGKDRRLARRIMAELYRFEQIEKAAQALVDHNRRAGNEASAETAQLIADLKKALKLSTEIENG